MGKNIVWAALPLNCDHVAQWLLTSDIEWMTKIWELPESHMISQFPLADINRDDCVKISSHINENMDLR